jgi:heme oxygenase
METVTEQCCGRLRTTAFCPDCGKKMKQESPLNELRKHCVDKHRIAVIDVNKGKTALEMTLMAKNGDTRDYDVRQCTRYVQNKEKIALRWKRWVDALDAILSPQEEKTNA